MFTQAIMVAGLLVVAGALIIGTLLSRDDGPSTLETALPPESELGEAPPTSTPQTRSDARSTPPQPPEALAPSATPQPSPLATLDFTGIWTVLYTITEGTGAGQSYSFVLSLDQRGTSISGGNDGVRVTGRAEGQVATLTYQQPGLGYTATFTWTLVDGTWGAGAFTSTVNAGTSRIQRRQ